MFVLWLSPGSGFGRLQLLGGRRRITTGGRRFTTGRRRRFTTVRRVDSLAFPTMGFVAPLLLSLQFGMTGKGERWL